MTDSTSKKSASGSGATSTSPGTSISRLELIKQVTKECLQNFSYDELQDPGFVQATILETVEQRIDIENASRPSNHRWKALDELMPAQIADIIAYRYKVVKIITGGENSDSEFDLLAIYQEDGPSEGIYLTSDETFRQIARQYNYGLTIKNFNEMINTLRDLVKRVFPCTDQDLIAVNNGIFNYKTKQLMPFSPDYIFMAKSKVNYIQNAINPIIHNPDDGTDWDVESWMKDLNDDQEIVNVLWEVLGAIIRPNVAWNKSAWFYSETGNNGKGTLCELMRQLCGDGTYASIPLSDMGKDFMLEPLTRATAIIVDENDVGTYIDKAANLKALITGDTIQINRKFKIPIPYQFHGFMVQCLNEMPRIKDKSDSFFRRQLFIPFEKCFTGAERKYIKHNYLHRQDVLEYVLHRVLNMNYYELSEPAACRNALEEYKEYNDPLRQFMNEIVPQLVWNLVPYSFMYDIYKVWYKRNIGEGKALGRNTFIKEFRILMSAYPEWTFPDSPTRTGDKMDAPEPLIAYYGLDEWKNHQYHGNDQVKICTVSPLSDQYRGMLKLSKAP